MSRDRRLDGHNMPWAVKSLDEIAYSRRESSGGPDGYGRGLENWRGTKWSETPGTN